MKRYSRLAQIEERKNIKKTYIYITLSLLSLLFLAFFGLPILIKFAGFIGDLAKSDKPIEINDTTPPAPPQFDQIPEFTKDEALNITGYSENGAAISLTSNGDTSEVITNNDGKFTFLFNLEKGQNTISAIAKDTAGNISTETKVFNITFDNTDPKLEITSPKDGEIFNGLSQKQLVIKGTVDEKVNLTINNRFVTIKDDGTFQFATTLNEGNNTFEIKATDPSGNESSTSLSVSFNP